MAHSSDIRELVCSFELTSSYGSEPNREEILLLGADVLPYFIEALPKASRWQQRASFLYHALRFADSSSEAVHLAIMALGDRSREVRYRACMLLACAQNKDTINELTNLLDHTDHQTREDAVAAIDAIKSSNHNYFVDRDHSGAVSLNFKGAAS